MKNLIVLLLILLSGTFVMAEDVEIVPKRDAYGNLSDTNSQLRNTCSAVARNFRTDGRFYSYIKDRCMVFEADKQRVIGIVYPFPNHREPGYNAKYPSYIASYSAALNRNELSQLKGIVNEYCKHNAYRFEKKDAQACSESRINSLFAN